MTGCSRLGGTDRRQRRCAGERGDAGPLEAVILVPVLLAAFGLVLAFGRTTGADGDVEHAARAGARAAVAAQTRGAAEAYAREVVVTTLADAGVECVGEPQVSVSGDMAPGGRVTVSVDCIASLDDLTSVDALPGSRTLSATASEVVDRVRGG